MKFLQLSTLLVAVVATSLVWSTQDRSFADQKVETSGWEFVRLQEYSLGGQNFYIEDAKGYVSTEHVENDKDKRYAELKKIIEKRFGVKLTDTSYTKMGVANWLGQAGFELVTYDEETQMVGNTKAYSRVFLFKRPR